MGGPVGLSQTRPIPRSPDGDNNLLAMLLTEESVPWEVLTINKDLIKEQALLTKIHLQTVIKVIGENIAFPYRH